MSESLLVHFSENAVEVLIMGMLGLFGTLSGLWAMRVVRKCSYLTGIVEHYCLLDLFGLTTINACHLLWAVPSSIWNLDEKYPFLGHFFGTLSYSVISLVFGAKILLGINRFFSVAFHGLFYRYLEEGKKLQYLVLFAYPFIAAIPLFFPGCRVLYYATPVPMFWTEKGECGPTYINIVQIYGGYLELFLTSAFDLATFVLLRKRLKELGSQQAKNSSRERSELKKQFRLAAQMVTQTMGTIAMNITASIAQFYVSTAFQLFILFTGSWQFMCWIGCLIYIIFQTEPQKPKEIIVTATGRSSVSVFHSQAKRDSQRHY